MAIENSTPIGYHDRYTRSTGWKKLLFRPGYPLQSAELIELQSMLYSEIRQLGSSIYKEGAAISGLNIVVNQDEKKVKIGKGQIYALGFVHDVEEGEVSIYGSGEEVIGIILTARVVTESELPELKDPQIGSEAYGYPGSHRLVFDYEYVSYRVGMSVNPDGSFTLNTGKSSVTIFLNRTHRLDRSDPTSTTTVAINNDGSISVTDSTGTTKVSINLDNTFSIVKPDGTRDLALDNHYSKAIKIAVLFDGYIDQTYTQLRPGAFDDIIALMAERTYDESGSYTVDKFKIEFKDLKLDDSNYNNIFKLIVKEGKAYVRGWKVENSVRVLEIDRPLETHPRLDEPETFISNTTEYRLDEVPVRNTVGIMATIRQSADMIRGQIIGGVDEIPSSYQPVASIHRLYDQYHGDYVNGTDYILSGNFIDWVGTEEPPPGGSYYVELDTVIQMIKGIRVLTHLSDQVSGVVNSNGTWALPDRDIYSIDIYSSGNVSLVPGTDYTINNGTGLVTFITIAPSSVVSALYSYWYHQVEGDFIGRDSYRLSDDTILYDIWEKYNNIATLPSGKDFNVKEQISFSTNSSRKPIIGSIFYVTYDYTLLRADVLVVDYRGRIQILKGMDSDKHIIPSISLDQMGICKLLYTAEARADDVTVEWYDNQRLTMIDLRTLVKEVKDIQYNAAVFQLYQDANNTPLPTDKRGIFADSFVTFDGSDLGNVIYAATVDVMARTVCLPQEMIQKSVTTTDYSVDNYFLLPYKDVLFVNQPYATDTIQVNPYTYVNIGCVLSVDPKVDNFVNETSTTVTGPTTITSMPPAVVRNSTYLWQHSGWQNNGVYANTTRQVSPAEWQANATGGQKSLSVPGIGTVQAVNMGGWGGSTVKLTSDSVQSNISQSVSQSIQVSVATMARVIQLTLTGKKYIPNEDNLVCEFDGTSVMLTPISPTRSGTSPGSIKANSDGSFTAVITVPENTKTGEHSIMVVYKGGSTGIAGSRGETIFSSQGINRHIINTVTFTEIRRRVVTVEDVKSVDPVAQTFKIDSPKFITKIGVFFKSVPAARDVWVEASIVPTDNGIPTDKVLGKATLMSQDCLPSNDAVLETLFTFDHPIYVEKNTEYALILRTDTSEYSIHISRMNQKDPVNGWVNTQPNSGILLTSANMSTWSAEQNADMKLNIYRASFTGSPGRSANQVTRTVNFSPLEFDQPGIGRFELNSAIAEPTDVTTIQWQYSYDQGSTWINFTPPVEVDMKRCVTILMLRAIITGDEITSPVLHNTNHITGYYWKKNGYYIHRQFELMDQDCRYIHIYMDTDTSGNCWIIPQIRLDDSDTWIDVPEEVTERRQLDQTWFERHYKFDSGSDSVLYKKIQSRLALSSINHYQTPRVRKYRVIATSL